jgi:two-component system chemotaxis response regulator CheB
MPSHDLVVLGASAGGLEALKALVQGLPPDFPAALRMVKHTTPHAADLLPKILAKAGSLPATSAVDGGALRPGHIYVAPPDHHLLVSPGHAYVPWSPTENRFRLSWHTWGADHVGAASRARCDRSARA